ncbi:SDR family oxidoreductase [Mycobacterium sp. E2479]|uniref:SDR family oxidoreductase n=1 Tax=Mycobacterium sp. E2479 TaxID=1834134 RepID=UPI0007FDC2C4|nr:SDR family oxidoreductase [Mycobacterium sp. E2479]OBH50378.1 oxidoreductase [Mycobacterium sp. E2479]
MPNWGQDLEGVRTLVVGASSGIGEAVAVAAHARGARVCVAARRFDRLKRLSKALGGSAHELDVSDPAAVEEVLRAVDTRLGGLDALVYTSAVVPFARIEETDSTTWMHAFAVNAVGASHVMRAAAPYFARGAVALVTSSHETGRPRVGVAAYNASKAALDEIWRSWGVEHPSVNVVRVNLGPTNGTEILRGADQDLLADLNNTWAQQGITSESVCDVVDVANTLLSLIANARRTPSVRIETVHIVPRPRAE